MPDQKALAESPVKAEDTFEETLVQAHDAFEDFISEKLRATPSRTSRQRSNLYVDLTTQKHFKTSSKFRWSSCRPNCNLLVSRQSSSAKYIRGQGHARLICPSICLLELAHGDFQIMGSGVMAEIFDLKLRSSSFPIRSRCCRCMVKD